MTQKTKSQLPTENLNQIESRRVRRRRKKLAASCRLVSKDRSGPGPRRRQTTALQCDRRHERARSRSRRETPARPNSCSRTRASSRQFAKTCTRKSSPPSIQEAKPARNPASRSLTDLPTSWDAIKPGHVVLIQDSLIGGWYEAIVVGRTGDKLTLRWRDYPGWPKVNVRASAVALVNPVGS